MTSKKINQIRKRCWIFLTKKTLFESTLSSQHASFFPRLLIIEITQRIRHGDIRCIENAKQNEKDVLKINSIASTANTFNYWLPTSTTTNIYTCPDDLDDTARALHVLARHYGSFLSVQVLADLTNILLALPRSPDGLYNTWINPPNTDWVDYDIVVNSALLRLLNECNIPHPALLSAIERCIFSDNLSSTYYSPLMICHELARLEISSEASATLRASMHRFYKHAASLHKPTFVEQAIYVSTLMRLGTSPETLGGILEKLIVDISTAKDEDLTCPVYTERIQSGVPITVGSAQLTCAYVAEACDTYLTLTDAADKKHTEREINYHTQIINNISLIITPFTDSKHVFEHILRQPKDGDSTKAITLLGYRWDYKNKKETSINDTFDIQIGLITILGWISYTIFDHVIDNEKDMAKHIPLAEHCNRLLHKHLNTLTTTPEQTVMISKLLNLIESAHYTECQSFVPPCWHKSAGHMIGPLLIIMKQGYGPASPRYKATKKFFITFLSAKQISDDLHDWENDWVNGRHTEVTEHIRRCAHTPTTLTQLRKIFAEKTLSFFSQQIIDHCTVALKALTHTGPHRNTEYFKKAVVKLQNSARRAILEVDVITLLKKDPVKN